MGRASLILVLTVAIALAVFGLSIRARNSQAVENSMNYYRKTRAKNISLSAAEIQLKKLMMDNYLIRNQDTIYTIMNGQATVRILQPVPTTDSVIVRSIGKFDGTTDTARITCTRRYLSKVTGAIMVSQNAKAQISIQNGGAKVTGNNYDPITRNPDLSCGSVDGISMGNRSDVSYRSLNFNNVGVSGSKGGPTPP